MRLFSILATILATSYAVNASPQGYGYAPAAPTASTASTTPTAAPTAPSSAPPAPVTSSTLNFNGKTISFPPMDKVPDTNDPQVKEWVKQLDLSKVPNLPVSNGGVVNPQQANCNPPTVIQPDQGSWTCQKFTASDDIQNCPTTGTWGLTYDDGPSPSTPKLLEKLKETNLKATLFVIGSRVVEYPQTLKAAYDAGHNIAVHTWSHPALTSLSNEAIVAEVKWTMMAIKNVIGVTPLYMRPPYGDTDNRVRAITKACGLKTVLWDPAFDSNDWTLTTTPPKQISFVVNTFETWMQTFPKMSTGFIVLEHDLFPQTVDAALIILDRAVKVPNLTIQTVPQCVGDSKPYLELTGNNGTTTTTTPSVTQDSDKNSKNSNSGNTVSVTTIQIILVSFSSLLSLLTLM